MFWEISLTTLLDWNVEISPSARALARTDFTFQVSSTVPFGADLVNRVRWRYFIDGRAVAR